MFEILLAESTPADQARSAVYYTMRLLRHRDHLIHGMVDLRAKGAPTEPSDAEVELALQAAQEIVQAEGTPLHLLSDQQAADYTHRLSAIRRQRDDLGPPYSPRRAQQLLEELREFGSRRRAATS